MGRSAAYGHRAATAPRSGARLVIAVFAIWATGGPASANPIRSDALEAFAAHCFSPDLTAARAAQVIEPAGARVAFYDLAPFSAATPSPAAGAVTPGTDRRCEVAFDGEYGADAAEVAAAALDAEGIRTEAPVPDSHPAVPGTTLLGARYLNPSRIAVVHTGTRPGPNGPETFLSVERLTPEASAEAAR
ncbi:succinyl-CoA synthetase subunit beta [Jannaschia sp. KMU-145]|uniref:succinyl-CoA synthetase subunit beta n=1 Tax=Jannaschia halovivens TaxID=3388667 RepID=UPI00396B1E65